jgi:hypothetical protein
MALDDQSGPATGWRAVVAAALIPLFATMFARLWRSSPSPG